VLETQGGGYHESEYMDQTQAFPVQPPTVQGTWHDRRLFPSRQNNPGGSDQKGPNGNPVSWFLAAAVLAVRGRLNC
jgi:hypothetical protein